MTLCEACGAEVGEHREVAAFVDGRERSYCRACFRDLYPLEARMLDASRESCPDCVAAGASWRDQRQDRLTRAMATIRPRRRTH